MYVHTQYHDRCQYHEFSCWGYDTKIAASTHSVHLKGTIRSLGHAEVRHWTRYGSCGRSDGRKDPTQLEREYVDNVNAHQLTQNDSIHTGWLCLSIKNILIFHTKIFPPLL